MKVLQYGIFLGILFFLIMSGGYYLYHTPIAVKQNCKNSSLYRYHFGIYQINQSDLRKPEKIIYLEAPQGTDVDDPRDDHQVFGWKHFLGLKPIACYDQLEYDRCVNNFKDRHHTEAQQERQWTLLRDNLYINPQKQLALKFSYTSYCGMNISEDVIPDPSFPDIQYRYYEHLGFNNEVEPALTDTIDLATFEQLEHSNFYKDKHHVYRYFAMLGGGSFSIFDEADAKSFKMIGDCYAQDSKHIFEQRSGKLEGVDYSTFTTKFGIGCIAKDKKGYWLWDSRESSDEEPDELIRERKQQLIH